MIGGLGFITPGILVPGVVIRVPLERRAANGKPRHSALRLIIGAAAQPPEAESAIS